LGWRAARRGWGAHVDNSQAAPWLEVAVVDMVPTIEGNGGGRGDLVVMAPGSRVGGRCGVDPELREGSAVPVCGWRWPAMVGQPWEMKHMSRAKKTLTMAGVELTQSPAQGGGGALLRRLYWRLGTGFLMMAVVHGRESRARWEHKDVAEGLPSRGSFAVVKWSTPLQLDKGDLPVHVNGGESVGAGPETAGGGPGAASASGACTMVQLRDDGGPQCCNGPSPVLLLGPDCSNGLGPAKTKWILKISKLDMVVGKFK
jgi:hypothetical protein